MANLTSNLLSFALLFSSTLAAAHPGHETNRGFTHPLLHAMNEPAQLMLAISIFLATSAALALGIHAVRKITGTAFGALRNLARKILSA